MDTEKFARLKQYMRVDHDEDDTLIVSLWEAAAAYLGNAGIQDNGSNLYWLAAAGLTLHWYDAAPAVTGSAENISLGLRHIINQLKMANGGI